MSGDDLWEDQGSLFRPSYSATWLNCLGALRPSISAADNAGYEAAVGTVFHWLIADWQENGRPSNWLGTVLQVEKEWGDGHFDVEVDEDMFYYAEECLDRYSSIPGDRFVEVRVDISDLTPIPKQGGTADLVILSPGILNTIDWKYGLGVQVFAKSNTQLLLYAWGAFTRWDDTYHFEIIRLNIAQPRLGHFDVWEISREELIEWAAWAKNRAHGAWERNADRTPSPKACQWCKVAVGCPALEVLRQSLVEQTLDDAFDDPSFAMPVTAADMALVVSEGSEMTVVPPDPANLPTRQLARIFAYRAMMVRWFQQIAAELVERAEAGEDLAGLWKLVESGTKRRWRNEEEAAAKFRLLGLGDDDIWEQKLASPAQIEKKLRSVGVRGELGKAFVRTLAFKPRGKPTLAPTGDARSALPDLADTFETIEEGDEL